MSGSEDSTARVWDLKAGSLRQPRAHGGCAHGVVASADGMSAVSFADDGALVWDVASGACVAALEGHDAAVRWAAAVAGGRVVTASADRAVGVWALPGGARLAALPGQQVRAPVPALGSAFECARGVCRADCLLLWKSLPYVKRGCPGAERMQHLTTAGKRLAASLNG